MAMGPFQDDEVLAPKPSIVQLEFTNQAPSDLINSRGAQRTFSDQEEVM
jgi:hypothetical protein